MEEPGGEPVMSFMRSFDIYELGKLDEFWAMETMLPAVYLLRNRNKPPFLASRNSCYRRTFLRVCNLS